MEPEGVLHRARTQTYAIPTAKGQTHMTPNSRGLCAISKSSTSPSNSSPDRNRVFEPEVAEGIPESLVEQGVEADSANRLCGVEAPSAEISSEDAKDADSPDGLFFHEGFLSFTSRDCLVLPLDLLAKFASKTKKLDLSFNCLVNVKGLDAFAELEELILDNNDLTDDINFPNLPKLKTLSINKNKVVDLDRFVSMCRWKFPALSFLSLVGNECCPNLNLVNDGDDEDDDYQRYRYAVIFKIPALKFLDFTPVSESERAEASRRGKFLPTVRVDEKALETLLASQSLAGTSDSAASKKKRIGGKLSEEPPKEYSPLPQGTRTGGGAGGGGGCDGVASTKEAYGKCRYVYYGKQSEGNRFIANETL